MNTIESNGLTFNVTFNTDTDTERPWDNSDGHGPVREASRGYHGINKRAGERVLYAGDRGEYSFVYDWQAACKAARADGWNCEPFDAPNRVERAVQADFDFLRLWCTGYWTYVGVTVKHADGREESSLWGVETYKDYHLTMAQALADELAAGILADRALITEGVAA